MTIKGAINMASFLSKIKIPDYSRGEDWANSITHMVGGGFGLVSLGLCLYKAVLASSWLYAISGIVYSLCMIALYSCSAVYHALRPNKGKKAMRIVDHSVIYLLIAGSVTPFALISISSVNKLMGITVFALAWGCAILGMVVTLTAFDKTKILQMTLNIAIGWAILFAIKPLYQTVGKNGLILMIVGGTVYTVGAIIYGIGSKRKYFHTVFHIFVLIGSIIHFLAIYLYVLVK